MGITGLLPVLKSITNGKHVSSYAGKKVAIDAYSWLHKGAYSCSRELCEGLPTTKWVLFRTSAFLYNPNKELVGKEGRSRKNLGFLVMLAQCMLKCTCNLCHTFLVAMIIQYLAGLQGLKKQLRNCLFLEIWLTKDDIHGRESFHSLHWLKIKGQTWVLSY